MTKVYGCKINSECFSLLEYEKFEERKKVSCAELLPSSISLKGFFFYCLKKEYILGIENAKDQENQSISYDTLLWLQKKYGVLQFEPFCLVEKGECFEIAVE